MFRPHFRTRGRAPRKGTSAQYEAARRAIGRWKGEPLEDRRMLSLSPWYATATGDMAEVREKALAAYQGDDLQGKDGPLASIGFDLALLGAEYTMHQEKEPGTAFVTSSPLPLIVSGDRVQIDVAATGDPAALVTQLTSLGMTGIARYGSNISGSISITKLPQLAALDTLRLARPAYAPYVNVGQVTSQADSALHTDEARALFGIDGTGVTVGVMSDSFNALGGMAADIASDDLPVDTTILSDSGTTDEGRAMAQLIHDLAPGAAIQFATANGGQATFAQNIVALADAGSDVIVDDVSYFAEPFFQDGIVAQAAQSVVARGIPFFSSAGNQADTSYESAFVDSGETGPRNGMLHDFDPGAEVATTQQITIPEGDEFIISFQWDQPFGSLGGGGSLSDLDISILGSDGTTVLANGMTSNVGGDPLEIISLINDGSFDFDGDDTPDTTFTVQIELVSGDAPGVLKYVVFTGGGTIDTFATNSTTDFGHHNTAGVIGVAASAFLLTPAFGMTPPAVNDFSSKGGLQLLFDTGGNRLATPFNPNSPQLTGVDGTNTTFFGDDISQDPDSFPNFFGTSAAAPHVAAVAALMIDLTGGPGGISVETIYDALFDTAIDIVSRFDLGSLTPIPIPGGGVGFDAFTGFGLVDAVAAMQQLVGVSVVNDVSVVEGDSGQVDAVFVVSLNIPVGVVVTVSYTTVDVTATAPDDYEPQSGVLTFVPGAELSQVVIVKINGDDEVEQAETFLLLLTDATGAAVIREAGVGTILNDDQDVSIGDVTVVEGHSGTRNAVFTVTTFGVVDFATSVQYATIDGTATTPADYLPRAGGLSFSPGVTSARITVPVLGDSLNEGSHSFFVVLHSPVGARIVDGVGEGTILDDDALPSFYVNDVQVTSTAAGRLSAVFTIGLDTSSGRAVTVSYATADGGAVNGTDYLGSAGTLTFNPGVTTLRVTVPVLTDGTYSPNKRFYLNLTSPLNALVSDTQGVCTIVYSNGPVNELILDNGDPGYSHSFSGWTTISNTLAYQLDFDYANAGTGSSTATWTFANIAEGSYQVFTRWIPFSNRATNASYSVLDGAAPLATVGVNQQVAPSGDQSNGVTWQSLGTFQVSTRTLVVQLGNNANGLVVADAVRIVGGGVGPAAPEIDVAGFDLSIAPGDGTPSLVDGTEFGEVSEVHGQSTRTYTISNNGNAPLHLTGNPVVVVGGAAASDFTVVSQPAATVAPGAKTTFTVAFDPSAVGLRQATLSIANDDAGESPYSFTVQGSGTGPPQGVFVVDDGDLGFSQLGSWTTTEDLVAFQGDWRRVASGDGSGRATWEFTGLAPGTYHVFATWVAAGEHASDAPFTVSNLAGNSYTLFVDQRNSPSIPFSGALWGSLGSIDAPAGVVQVRATNDADGFVVADAVVLVREGTPLPAEPPPAPPVVPLAHNATLPQDVNGDNQVSPHDALLVINRIMASAASQSAAPLAATSDASSPTYFVDVNGDGQVSPHDVLMVINYLLSQSTAAPLAAPLAAAAPEEDAAALVAVAVDLAIDSLDDFDPADDPAPRVDLAIAPVDLDGSQVVAVPAAVQASFEVDEDESDETETSELELALAGFDD